MRFPRLNSDFVSSKSEAFAIAYPKKTLSALVSAALLAVCCTSASAGSVAISTASGYLYDKSGLSGNVSLPVDGRKIFRKSDLKEMKAKTLTSVLSLKETSTSFSYPTEITPTNLR